MIRRRPSLARNVRFSAFKYSIFAAACRCSQQAMLAISNARKFRVMHGIYLSYNASRQLRIRVFEHNVRRSLHEFADHYHRERNHQGLCNRLIQPFPARGLGRTNEQIHCRSQLGGALRYYERGAA